MATVKRTRWESFRGWGIGFVVGLAVGGIAAGVVYVNGREALVDLDAARAQDREAAEARASENTAALEAASSMEALLRARVSAANALDEVDRANYGLARDALRTAGAALARVDAVAAGVDPAALDAARQEVANAIGAVAPDPDTLRAYLVRVEQAVDRLLPRERQG